MPGFELMGEEERRAVNEVFDRGGCLFRYGFETIRKNTYKTVEFEQALTTYLGVRYGHAVSSGTAALFTVNKALGIQQGDEVITQAFTFVATAEAIIEAGAIPVMTAVDQTLNMDPEDLERKITERTKAIWVVHMLGGPARIAEILEIGARRKIPVLEDAAEALGARYRGRFCGTWGAAGVFSFDFGKLLTTGEGGMAVTNDEALYQAIRAYADHGHEDNPHVPRGEDTASRSGFNFRMMELQGAVGLAQLRKIPQALATLQTHWTRLNELLRQIPELEFRETPTGGIPAGDAFVFFLKSKEVCRRVSDYLASRGLSFKVLPGAVKWHFAGHWDHLWRSVPGYDENASGEQWSRTLRLLERAIAIPIMIRMSEDNIRQITASIKEAIVKTAGRTVVASGVPG